MSLAEQNSLSEHAVGLDIRSPTDQLTRFKRLYELQVDHENRPLGVYVSTVQKTVEQIGIDPSRIKLELTESMILNNIEEAISKMNQLKALGFSISFDDFGTGYSSLSYLKRLPFNQIKIDRSFIISATTNEKDAFLVQFVISMGEKFNMDIIAEGIETVEQFKFLETLNCRAFQGFLFGKPMPVTELESHLHNNQFHALL